MQVAEQHEQFIEELEKQLNVLDTLTVTTMRGEKTALSFYRETKAPQDAWSRDISQNTLKTTILSNESTNEIVEIILTILELCDTITAYWYAVPHYVDMDKKQISDFIVAHGLKDDYTMGILLQVYNMGKRIIQHDMTFANARNTVERIYNEPELLV